MEIFECKAREAEFEKIIFGGLCVRSKLIIGFPLRYKIL